MSGYGRVGEHRSPEYVVTSPAIASVGSDGPAGNGDSAATALNDDGTVVVSSPRRATSSLATPAGCSTFLCATVKRVIFVVRVVQGRRGEVTGVIERDGDGRKGGVLGYGDDRPDHPADAAA